MDKLKPILAQKFWIFFGLVLILPVVGYFMAKGELAAQITTRWDSLEKTFKDIPPGTDCPNEQWLQGLTVLNDQQKLHNRLANEALWRVQKEKMRWPDDIAAVMNKAEYFKAVSPEQGGSDVPFKYPLTYLRQIRRLWEIVDPLDDGKNLRDSDKRRKISFAMVDLYQLNSSRWAELPPTFDVIWGAQEDIWLQTELLQAIARVNSNAISQGDAFVKSLGKIQLFGGTRKAGDVGGATGVPAAPPGAEGGAFPGAGTMGMGGGTKSDASVSAEINIAEEFDISIDPNAGAASGTGNSGGGGGGFAFSADPAGKGGVPAAGGGTGGKSDVKRYIDDDENAPYKRRGFSIKVVMDHTKVPDLIAELMNSPFPVEIVRVHQAWLSDSAAAPGGTGGGSFGVGGGGEAVPFAAAPTPDEAGAGASPRTASGGSSSQTAMSDPNLAQVTILGIWTLYRPPPPAVDAGQPVPNTAAPMPNVAAAPAAATPPSTENGSDVKPAVAEASDSASDEPKKPDEGDAPKKDSDPAKSDKPDADKPAEKTPPEKESAEKPEAESK